MSYLKEISDIPYMKFIAYLFCISTSVCPGILFLFIHRPELFTTVNFMLLIVLAAAITNPILLTNIILSFQYIPFEVPNRFEIGLLAGSFTSYIIFGIALLLDFFLKLSSKLTVICIIVPELIWVLCIKFSKINIRDKFMKSFTDTRKDLQ